MPAVYPLKITTKVEEMAAGDYLAVDAGGTGQTVYVVGDLLYASGVAALSRLAAGAPGTVLTMGAAAPQWSTSLDMAGTIRSKGLAVPASGQGVEFYYIAGSRGVLTAYDRTAGLPLNLQLVGLNFELNATTNIDFYTAGSLIGRMNVGILAWGTTFTASATTGEMVLAFQKSLRGVNSGGTDTLPLIQLTTGNVVQVGGSVTVPGTLAVTGQATFAVPFAISQANFAGPRSWNLENTNTGTTGTAEYFLQNSTSSLITRKYSTGFTSSGIAVAAGSAIYDDGAGGLAIGAMNSVGNLRFWARGVLSLTIGDAQRASFVGPVDFADAVSFVATKKLHFNGIGGNSYIQEAGAGVLYVVSGNILSFAARAGVVTIGDAVATSCTAGDLSFVRGRGIRSGNDGGTDTVHVLSNQIFGSMEAIVIGGSRPVIIGSMSGADATNNTLALTNATAPSVNPVGGGFAYADAGALKWRGSAGTVTTVAPA